jgi:hypothetical protein
MPLAIFGITNSGLNLFVNLLILFLVVVWLSLVVWTYLDARRRISDPFLVACATAASLFPYVGTIVYTILRPPEFIDDARERELEIRASELRLRQLEEQSCPNCEFPVERNFLRCPNCRTRVKDPCESCGKPIDPRWSVCPYCEMPVRKAAPTRRPEQEGRRQSRSARSAERAEKQDRKAERAEKQDRKAERAENQDRKADRADRQDRKAAERAGRAERSERSEQSEQSEQSERPTRSQRSDAEDGNDSERSPDRPRKKPSGGGDRPSRATAS